ncbi:MAG: NADH-quinone oxidoreductase subunit N [Anaerolineae bacterium]
MTLSPLDLSQLGAVAPEILLLALDLGILALDLLTKRGNNNPRELGFITAIGLIAILAFSVATAPPPNIGAAVLGGMMRYDLFTSVMRGIFLLAGAFTALLTVDFRPARAGGEFYALLVLAVLAMGLMAGANDMILLYLATEVASISLYLLAGFMRDDKRSSEAGLKYFVFGAVTSTVMLYGLSLIYGIVGSTNYTSIQQAFELGAGGYLGIAAMIMVVVGFLFKTSAVPLHFWAPDVYDGAPTPVSGFISTASKTAGFAIMLRFLEGAFTPEYSAAGNVWPYLMIPVAILTMFVGNLGAAVQTSVKRMLAFSSVGQAGYVFIGVAAFANVRGDTVPQALAAIVFYLATYMITNIAAFAVVGVISQRVGGENYKDFAGLGRRSPYLALAMVAAMVSLLGAPPMVGFAGKFYLFRSAIAGAANDPRMVGLVVVGVINVLISVYYYLGVVKAMYVDKTAKDNTPLKVAPATMFVIVVCAIGTIATLVGATPVYNLALEAAKAFLSN